MHAPTHRARRHAAGSTRSAATAAACLAAVAILAGACSSSGDEASPGTTATATGAGDVGSSGSTITTWDPDRLPSEIVATPVEGNGIVLPQPAAPLPAGYEQQEYLVDGTATSFAAVETPDDGFWTVEPSGEADYRTRVIVRRPGDPACLVSGGTRARELLGWVPRYPSIDDILTHAWAFHRSHPEGFDPGGA